MGLLSDDVDAFLFDMDGTLIDSERLTEAVVAGLLALRGVAGRVAQGLDYTRFHGVTWAAIAAMLRAAAPELGEPPPGEEPLADELQRRFHRALIDEAPQTIPGAPEAVRAAAGRGLAALVTSSQRASAVHIVARLGLGEAFSELVCAEDVARSKPDPECYLAAAARLGVPPARCLVFEDSEAGLLAARAAGMRTVAIGGRREPADLAVADFTLLPPGFLDPAEVRSGAPSDAPVGAGE